MKKFFPIIMTVAICFFLFESSSGQELKSVKIAELNVLVAPPTAAGTKIIYPITGGTISGEINGKVLPIGGDFGMLISPTTFKLDIREVIQTTDSATIYITYNGYIHADPGFFLLGAIIVIAGFLVAYRFRIPDLSSIVVIVVALAAGILIQGFPPITTLSVSLIPIPSASDMIVALEALVVPQAILTITNAILATSLLAKDLFSADIRPKKLSRTIGLMNLTSIPFGGMPMCHGAGGMAGQYRFGARTGGANIYAGVILVGAALLFASTAWLSLISPGFYAALLIFVAIELGRHGLKTSSYLVTLATAIFSLLVSMTVAFIVGMCLAYGIPYVLQQIRQKSG